MAIADTIVIMNNGGIHQGDPQRIYLKRYQIAQIWVKAIIDGSVVYSRSGLTAVETQIGRFELRNSEERRTGDTFNKTSI